MLAASGSRERLMVEQFYGPRVVSLIFETEPLGKN